MTLQKLLTFAVAALLLLAFSAPAQANPGACYAWFCVAATGQCSFDATCSGDDPLDYRWTWGDGSSENHINYEYASHSYNPSGPAFYTVKLSVGYLFIGYYDVTCQIQIHSVISPPEDYFFGACT